MLSRLIPIVLCLIALGGVPGSRALVTASLLALPQWVEADSGNVGHAQVRVTDEKGWPIAGAEVVAIAFVKNVARLAGRGTTKGDGILAMSALPEGEHWFVARAPQRARAAVNVVIVGSEPREIALVMTPEHALEVLVTDDKNAPIDAEIEVRAASGPLPFGARAEGGRATVMGLAAGPWSVTARAAGYEQVTEPTVKEGAPLTIVLRRLSSLFVHVEDEGRAVEGASVQITGPGLWPPREGKTGPRGIVKMAGLFSGAYALRATLGERVSPVEIGIPLARGEDKELTLRLGPGRRVLARVTDGDAEDAPPIAGARVTLAEGGLAPFPFEGTTDRGGRVLLGPIAPGTASVSASADGFIDGGPVSAEGSEARVALFRSGALSGRVIDARGRPIDGATLEVVGTDDLGMPIDDEPARASFRRSHFDARLAGPAPLLGPLGGGDGELGVVPGPVPPIPRGAAMDIPRAPAALPPEPWVTRADGGFRLSPVTPGRVRVIARHPQFVEGESEIVRLTPGAERAVTVIMRAGGALEGRVVDASDRPVTGASVVVAAARGSLERSTRTGTDGSFAFASLPDAVSVSVYTDDALHPLARRALEIPEGGKKEIVIALPAAREAMVVSVRDERGFPLAMAQVTAVSLDAGTPLRVTAFTDARGEARIASVVTLPLSLEVSAPRAAPKQLQIERAPRSLEVALDPAESVTGEVRSRRGEPIAEATVVAYGAAGARRVKTDARGSFTLEGWAPGALRVRVEAEGWARAEASALVKKGAGTTSLGRIELQPEAILEGKVTTARGDPVRGARVAVGSVPLYVPVGASGITTTDSAGAFKLRGVSEGTITVEAYAPDVGRARQSVRAEAGRATRDVNLVLVSDGESEGPRAPASVAVTLAETGEPREVLIAAVAEGSEAERAGLAPGDVLLEVDGAPVRAMSDARARLGGPKGDDVVLKLRRDGRPLALRVPREPVRK